MGFRRRGGRGGATALGFWVKVYFGELFFVKFLSTVASCSLYNCAAAIKKGYFNAFVARNGPINTF